jgi:hypothetical protein
MLINIAIEKTQPLTGTATSNGKAPVPFAGWLELLRAVAELVGTPEQPTEPVLPAAQPTTRLQKNERTQA